MKKLYEYVALIKVAVVIASDKKLDADKIIREMEDGESVDVWLDNGDKIGVCDVDLTDVRNPDTQDELELEDLAHIVIKKKGADCGYSSGM